MSTIEDILTVATSVLLIVAPIIGIILLVILVLLMARLLIGVVRRFRGRKVAATMPGVAGGAPARRNNQALQPDYVSGPPAGGSPAAGPSPILQMPSLQAPVPTQPYPPSGGFSGDPPTMPGQMH